MSKKPLKEIDRNKLPWVYRLILKIPGADFLESTSSGIFWGIVVPIFVGLEIFLNLYFIVFYPFPMNVILVLIVPVVMLLVFARISLERFINWWNMVAGETGYAWNVEKSLQEYLVLLKEKKEEKHKNE